MKNKIYFRNLIQVALFEEELKGQLSDGFWENTRPFDHWKPWCSAEAVVVETGSPMIGRNFYADKKNYDFNSSTLIDYVGDRMLAICQAVAGQGFTMKMMRAELKDMKNIIKLYVAEGGVR